MGIRVTLQDARAITYCSPGMRKLCEQYGLDWWDFVKNGVDSNHLLQVTGNDAMAQKAVQAAQDRINSNAR